MGYDPRDCGAKCDECILGPEHAVKYKLRPPAESWRPVPDEVNPNAIAAWIGEGPGEDEVKYLRPFVGKSGEYADAAVRLAGYNRSHLSWVNAASCQMGPKSDSAWVLTKLKRINKKRAKEGKPPLLPPFAACAPRFQRVIAPYANLMPVGGTAVKNVFQDEKASIMSLRGGTNVLWRDQAGKVHYRQRDAGPNSKRLRVMPTIHPAAALPGRSPRLQLLLRSDVAKAFRWFTGRLRWKDPHWVMNPSPDELAAFLSRRHDWLLCDVETVKDTDFWAKPEWIDKTPQQKLKSDYGWDPLTDKLRCIGVGTADEVYVVFFRSVDGTTQYYTKDETQRLIQMFRDFLTGPIVKVGHNFAYDWQILERYCGVEPKPMLDTILMHRLVESEFPHSLGFIGSIYTDVDSWKADKTAVNARTDKELGFYNAIDCSVNAKVVDTFVSRVRARRQDHLVPLDHKVQRACVWMHKAGILIDQERRQWYEDKYQRETLKWLRRCRALSEHPNFNPGSTQQVADLLFEDWGLPVKARSEKTDDPATDKDTLVKLYLDPAITTRQKRFIHCLRRYRRVRNKLLGTYLKLLRPIHENGVLYPDGRLRTGWNPHVTVTGRLSSSDPVNLQNQPIFLRDVYWASPGCVFVGADQDQLELKIVSSLAQIPVYLDAFANGDDPHALTARMVFGEKYDRAPGTKKSGTKGRMRDFAKRVCYATLYGANDETVYMQVVGAENDRGDLIFADQSKRRVKLARQRFLEAIPELPRWWDKTIQFWREHGYVESAILKRRRDCLDGEELNTLVNHPAQSTGADIMNLVLSDLMDEMGFEPYGPNTGLIAQVHDSLLVEVPESRAFETKTLMTDLMHRRFDALPSVVFEGEADVQRRWDSISCVY